MTPRETLAGRKHEKEVLEQFLRSGKAEFMAMYGRRRVGKTFLIRQFFAKKQCCFFNATGIFNESFKRQLSEFCRQIGRTFFSGTEIKEKNNWFDALELLSQVINKQIPKNKKVVLFFDEFPWMATPRSKLLQALEYYWNQYWSQDSRIKLIVCGSAASWILKKIIFNKGGLHNRLTRTIQLEPLKLNEAKKMLRSMGVKLNNKHILQIYMLTGGVPYYLSYIPRGLTDVQIIEKLAFSKNSLFLEEFDKLYASLFKDSGIYVQLIKTIAAQRNGISQTELFKKIKKISRGGAIVEKLRDLENSGFIVSFRPYHHRKKGVFYKVIDEYTLFYLQWIDPIKQTLLKKGLRKGYWEKMAQSNSWFSWTGYSFEAICYKHLPQISKALNLSPIALPSAWQYIPKKKSADNGAQIDLLFDREDNAITICEIKYTSLPFAIDKEYAMKLSKKLSIFEEKTHTQKQLFLVMISAHGLKRTMYSEEMVDDIVTLDDLFLE